MVRPMARWFPSALLGVALPAQPPIVVSGGGASLQNAINAALPGDVLDVMPGGYSPVTCSIGVRIALRPGAVVGASPLSPAAMVVTGIPAGQTFVVDGGKVFGLDVVQAAGQVVVTGVALEQVPAMRIDACPGPVAFDEVAHQTSGGLVLGALEITNSAQVSFTGCLLPSTTVTNSRVCLTESRIVPYGFAPGLVLASGSVTVSGGRIAGATNASFPIPAPGVEITQGVLAVTGGATIQPSPSGLFLQTPAITAASGTIRLDPSVTLLGGAISGGATVVLATIPSLVAVRAATTLIVDVSGEPGSGVFTLLGLPVAAITTPFGDAWLLPSDAIVHAAVLPAAGGSGFAIDFASSFPSAPSFVPLVLQSVALAPGGAITIGAPVRFVWRW